MNTGLLIVIIVVLVIIALLAVVVARRRRSQGLQTRFGPELHRRKQMIDAPRKPNSQSASSGTANSSCRTRARRPSALPGGMAGGPGPVRRRPRHGHPRG